MSKRRLLKDLPFLKAGTVVYQGHRGSNSLYSVSNGDTYYESGGSSSNGINVFSGTEQDVISLAWDNPEWFEEATLKHIDVIPGSTSITLRFKPIDRGDAEDLAKGIVHILPHLADKPSNASGYVWNRFVDITTQIKNN